MTVQGCFEVVKRLILLIACLAILMAFASPAQADSRATADEALTVATNWIALITHVKGHWAGSRAAKVEECREFRHGERTLGYFCPVNPRGFIVVSLFKVLAPVKAYSTMSDLNPESNEGMADLIKGKMEHILEAIERQLGPIETAPTEAVENILEINYHDAWEQLGIEAALFEQDLASGHVTTNYQGGKVLLSSEWHQDNPYYRQCPTPQEVDDDDCDAPHCTVGCGPLAAGQVMRYWSWPPFRDPGNPYDWPNMPDTLTRSSPQAQIDAVARLLHEIGIEAGADYCGGESSPCATSTCFASCAGKDLLDTFEDHFWYSDEADDKDRDDDTAEEWFNRMKTQFNKNRPIPYRVEGHILVADGWQEIGSPPLRQYHMNYGWGWKGTCQNGCNTWYTLDALYLGGVDEERMLEDIYPATALGNWLSGPYSAPYPFYFDQDAAGSSATFSSGANLQFLPGVTVTGISTTGDAIRFEGSSSANTRLFTNGDMSKGIRIHDGTIKLMNNGSITLLPLGHPRYLFASEVTSYRINLAWEAGHGHQDGFEIERRVESGPYTYLTTVGASFYADHSVNPDSQYCYRIRAIRFDGARSYPKELCVKTPSASQLLSTTSR